MKYIIYCRKSSESEDRQVKSIEAQEREMFLIAKRENLHVVKILKESQSAKDVGRPIFNEMIKLLKEGKVDGILTWKLDRLARNFIDGGIVIDMLQKGSIKQIKTYEQTCSPSDNVLMLAVEFGMANQYVRDLSTNVKRGNREKLERGEWPNHAPFGYLNDKVNKKIIVDLNRAKYVKRAFDLYSTKRYSYKEVSNILFTEGLKSCNGKKIYKGKIHKIISNKFYYGIMERDNKLYSGKHPPLISKELYDKANSTPFIKSRPRRQKHFFPLTGLFTCEVCGCAITAEIQKGYRYYHCTDGKGSCDQKKYFIREEKLNDFVSDYIKKIQFDEELVEIMYLSAKEKIGENTNYQQHMKENVEKQLQTLENKISKLLDLYLSEQISKEVYDKKNKEMLLEKSSLKIQLKSNVHEDPLIIIERTKEIFLTPNKAVKEYLHANDERKHRIANNLLSNLTLKDRKMAQVKYKSPYDVLARTPINASFSTMLPDRDSNPDNRLQKPVSYH